MSAGHVNMSTSSNSTINSAAAGVTGGYDGNSLVLKCLIVFCNGLTMYNALELLVLVFITFSRYRGLYFWSLLISSFGLIPYAIGLSFKYFNVLTGNARLVSVAIMTLGWYLMVTGQSVVLWSRLHLIVNGESGRKILQYTKWMIIVDAIILHIPTSVVTFGSNGDLNTAIFVRVYNVVEKFQMTGFFLQEVILSSIYIVETLRILRTSLRPRTRPLMHQLIFINFAIIIMDMALLSLECANLFLLESVIKGVTYSIKLKLEFAILSRLVEFVGEPQTDRGHTNHGRSMTFLGPENPPRGESNADENDVSSFLDLTKIKTDFSHASPVPKKSRFSAYGDDLDLDIEIAGVQHVEKINCEVEGENVNGNTQLHGQHDIKSI